MPLDQASARDRAVSTAEASVLVVEDDAPLRTLVERRLRQEGYVVEGAASAPEALTRLADGEAAPPDVVLLDYRLAEMTGADLIRQLRERDLPVPPFIVMTGYGDERIAVEMMKLGARDYLAKDTRFVALLPAVVHRVVDALRQEARLARTEAEREDLETRLEAAQRIEGPGLLASGIALELGDVLTGILGHADLALLDLSPDAPAREHVRALREESHRAVSVCRQILVAPDRGRGDIERVDLNALVRQLGTLLAASLSQRVRLDVHLSPADPAFEGDLEQTRQVILSLVRNAAEAIGDRDGTIVLSTDLRHRDRDFLRATWPGDPITEGDYVSLSVTGTESGMDAANGRRGPASLRSDALRSERQRRGGLGLATILATVRRHRGAIRVQSTPGRGSTFEVLFPADRSAA